MTANTFRFPFWNMADSSAKDLYQMGSFTGCNKLEAEGHANYTMINIYMTTVPSEVKMGFCIPSDCNENSLSRVQTMIYYYLQPHCATIFSSGIFDAQKQLNETDV